MIRLKRCDRHLKIRSLLVIAASSIVFTFITLSFSSGNGPGPKKGLPLMAEDKLNGQYQKAMKIEEEDSSLHQNQDDDWNVPKFEKDTRPPLSVKRMAEYCNNPIEFGKREEGLYPSNYQLVAVHTVIRHGDRSPIFRLKQLDKSGLSCLVDSGLAPHLPKLEGYVATMAAGSASQLPGTPFYRWALYPNHAICSEGLLTGQGAVQHLQNGMHAAQRYLQTLMPNPGDWHRKFLVHSTEVSRTYQSAVAYAYGLLPDFDLAKLQIFRASGLDFCEDRTLGPLCHCQGLDSLRGAGERDCRLEPPAARVWAALKAHVDAVLGLQGKRIPGPSSLMDAISYLACHSVPLPCNSKGVCLTAQAFETVWKLVDSRSRCLQKNENFNKFSRALMFGLFHRIHRDFEGALKNMSVPAIHLYSGHDNTITPLLVALGANDVVWPPFATTINFELFKDKASGEAYIKLLMNGVVFTKEAVFCSDSTNKDGMCPLSKFSDFVKAQKIRTSTTCDQVKPKRKH